jgi:mannose-6-phosphate isomerase-like protein (cupin superfamily)
VVMKVLNPSIPPDLYRNCKKFESEVVYEITTQECGLPFGIAIADIVQSAPHYHKRTEETYLVVQGELEVSLGEESHILHIGQALHVPPGVVHSARSRGDEPARLVVICIPEYSQGDNFAAGAASD